MTLRLWVMISAAVLVLAFIWWRGRRLRDQPAQREDHRGVLDEAVTAYEDVAEQVIGGEDLSRPRGESGRSSKPRPPARDA